MSSLLLCLHPEAYEDDMIPLNDNTVDLICDFRMPFSDLTCYIFIKGRRIRITCFTALLPELSI